MIETPTLVPQTHLPSEVVMMEAVKFLCVQDVRFSEDSEKNSWKLVSVFPGPALFCSTVICVEYLYLELHNNL